ncbi:MAG: PilW family protein [Steroidobacter sp.]
MQRLSSNVSRIAGFSLVELMVAITLSLLLLTGVIAIFSSSRVSYETTHQLSRVQETGRFALEQLARHIRSSGFAGCARQPNYISSALNNATALQWDFMGSPVRGFEASAEGFVPALTGSGVETAAIAGSDVLVVRGPRLEAEPTQITADMANPQAPVVVANTSGIRAGGEVVMAYNCEAQAIFFAVPSGTSLLHTVGSADAPPSNSVASTSYQFGMNDEVVPVESVVYFVAPTPGSTGANPTVPAGTNSLWRRAGVSLAEELVQGVEQMQVEYGMDTDGDRIVDTYSVAGAATNWQQVISVRVALLVRSVDQYGSDKDQRTYQLLNSPPVAPPGDRRLREVFSATVSIRNRVRVD